MKVEGLEEGPRTPTKKEIQPSLNYDEIPSDDDDDGSVDYNSLDDTEVNIDAYNFEESAKNGEVLVIKDEPNGALSGFRGRLSIELSNAAKRYVELVTPITNRKDVDKTTKDKELTAPALLRMQFDLLKSIEIKTGPNGERYIDIDEVNNKVEKLYADLNSSYKAIATKNGYQFRGILRTPKIVGTNNNRTFGGSLQEYLSEKAQKATNERLEKAYPKDLSGKSANLTELVNALEISKPKLPKQLKGPFREITRKQEYDRLMEDTDFRSTLGRMIAGYGSDPSITRYFLSEEELKNMPKESSINSPENNLGNLERAAATEFVDLAHKIYALNTVGGFNSTAPAKRYFRNASGDTIIALPENSNQTDLSPSVNIDYIQAALEAIDRSVVPNKSSIVRKINFVNTSDYPGKIEEGELGHTNSATLEVNIFMDRLSDVNDKYNAAPPEEKDKMLRRFASPNAWDSMESLYKYTVAHELGHIMAFSIWDHREINSNFNKSGPPTWRFRSGITDMQKEINPIKQLEPVSDYGKQSTDEYWAEAYAKWVVDNDASDSFKQILDDYGLIRGKARRWVTDDTSTNPAARETISESVKNSQKLFQKIPEVNFGNNEESRKMTQEMVDDIPYIGEYGEQATKEQLKILADILGLDNYLTMNDDLARGVGSVVQQLGERWKDSTTSNSSVAMMYAAREEFDIQNALPLTGRAAKDGQFLERKKQVDYIDKIMKENPEAFKLYKQILRAQYNLTQRALKDAGIEEFLVFKGWPGAGEIKDMVVVPTRPITPFSVTPSVATGFGGGGGSVTAMIVQAKDIFNVDRLFSGYKHTHEVEVLLLGGAREAYGYDPNEKWPGIDEVAGTGKEVLID